MRTFLSNSALFAALLAGILSAACSTAQSPRRQVQDTTITAEIKSKLVSEVSPSSVVNVEVNTTNGIVTLPGQVENEEIKSRAEQVARSVTGVVGINNHLQVEAPGASREEQKSSGPPHG